MFPIQSRSIVVAQLSIPVPNPSSERDAVRPARVPPELNDQVTGTDGRMNDGNENRATTIDALKVEVLMRGVLMDIESWIWK